MYIRVTMYNMHKYIHIYIYRSINTYVETCIHASKQYTQGLAFAVQQHLPEMFGRSQEGGPRGQEEDKARLEREAAGEVRVILVRGDGHPLMVGWTWEFFAQEPEGSSLMLAFQGGQIGRTSFCISSTSPGASGDVWASFNGDELSELRSCCRRSSQRRHCVMSSLMCPIFFN